MRMNNVFLLHLNAPFAKISTKTISQYYTVCIRRREKRTITAEVCLKLRSRKWKDMKIMKPRLWSSEYKVKIWCISMFTCICCLSMYATKKYVKLIIFCSVMFLFVIHFNIVSFIHYRIPCYSVVWSDIFLGNLWIYFTYLSAKEPIEGILKRGSWLEGGRWLDKPSVYRIQSG